MLRQTITRLEKSAALDPVSDRLQGAVESAAKPGRLRDLLHGTVVGHPVHPVLVQVPVGSFLSAAVLDVVPGQRRAATLLIGLGVASTGPAIAAGLVDWASLAKDQQRVGLVHATANTVALGLYAGSLAARWSGRWGLGRFLAYAGLSVAGAGAYLGGHLSYKQGAGVNLASAELVRMPDGWTELGAVAALPEGRPVVREVEGVRVLLYRQGEEVTAMIEQCGHQGGPLGDGKVEGSGADACVVCPWHGSTFRLVDGTAKHGPAAADQPLLRTRVNAGKLAVAPR
ncbi:Rieske 2Fe-2S domain-containing protein [Actinoplanes sp. RD1]|uniref:Rieske 2Fe-2S domain-containing protein n=1 Tax=Actinoplanes sp. RD1 TaxID=3064538 RepID=UPI0027414EFA|nr:Rieske 2Fe-2S domain-containing protein [Actinoplanes sp. RD1]